METGAQQESTAWRQRSGREGKKYWRVRKNEEDYMLVKKKQRL